MKRAKPQKTTIPVSVSAKKSGPLKHQLLFTPYKLEWKNIQPAPVSQTSSRTFFNTMKNDLSNLKNDVERMIKKEIGKPDIKHSKIGVLEDTSNCKNDLDPKFFSGSSKPHNQKDQIPQTSNFDTKPNFPPNIQNSSSQQENLLKFDLVINQKESREKHNIENLLKETRIQKNLITELKRQNQELYTEVQQKGKTQSQLQRSLRLQKQSKATQIERLSQQVERLKMRIIELEDDVQNQKIKNADLQKKIEQSSKSHENEVEDLRSHNSFLEQKIEGLSEKMSIVSGKFKEKQLHIKELQTKLEAFKVSRRQHQIQEEEEKKQIIEEWRAKIQQKQKQCENKLQERLKNSQTQFMQQIQYIEARTKQAVSGLEEENFEFSQKIKQLEQQIRQFKIASSKNSPTSSQVKSVKSSSEIGVDFGLLGAEYEKKINDLVSQNYELKNKITELESQIQSREIEIGSLLQQIKLYEELKEYQKTNQSASSIELEKTILQLHDLKRQKDAIIEQFEFKIMKLENELETEKNSKPQKIDEGCGMAGANFNKILKEQLQENQQLKQKLKQQIRQNNSIQSSLKEQEQKISLLSEELALQKMKVALSDKNQPESGKQPDNLNQQAVNLLKRDLEQVKKKYEALNSMMETKNKLIKSKDEFIEKVLISKAGKKEEQDQIAYILKQLRSCCGQSC